MVSFLECYFNHFRIFNPSASLHHVHAANAFKIQNCAHYASEKGGASRANHHAIHACMNTTYLANPHPLYSVSQL